jgi:hypothetical protein
MSEGMRLFDNFTTLTKAPKNDVDYTSEIINAITNPSSFNEDSMIKLCKTYHDSSFHESDLDALDSSPGNDKETRALELLKKIGRIQILDITEEIKQLREVKDIQDELSIMAMLYEDLSSPWTVLSGQFLKRTRPHKDFYKKENIRKWKILMET